MSVLTNIALRSARGVQIRALLRTALRRRHWIVLVLMVSAGVLAPVLAPYGKIELVHAGPSQPPSVVHLFGTDSYGFDVFSRVLYATGLDLSIATSGVLIGILIGVPVGVFAAYVRGLPDDIVSRVVEMIQAFPHLLLAMIIFAAAGNLSVNLVVVIVLLNASAYARIVRGIALPLRDAEFVLAARVVGQGTIRIILREIAPNVLTPVFGQFAISAALAIQLVAALSFIGLGVRVPEPEWGSMINIGSDSLYYGYWWAALFPGLAVAVTTWALAGVGSSARRWAESGW